MSHPRALTGGFGRGHSSTQSAGAPRSLSLAELCPGRPSALSAQEPSCSSPREVRACLPAAQRSPVTPRSHHTSGSASLVVRPLGWPGLRQPPGRWARRCAIVLATTVGPPPGTFLFQTPARLVPRRPRPHRSLQAVHALLAPAAFPARVGKTAPSPALVPALRRPAFSLSGPLGCATYCALAFALLPVPLLQKAARGEVCSLLPPPTPGSPAASQHRLAGRPAAPAPGVNERTLHFADAGPEAQRGSSAAFPAVRPVGGAWVRAQGASGVAAFCARSQIFSVSRRHRYTRS